MELEQVRNQWGSMRTKCPICGELQKNVKAHIMKKADKKHKEFYLKNSKEVIIKRRVLDI